MATRTTIREEVERRVGDTTNLIWSDPELNGFIGQAVGGLYPVFYRMHTGTTTAGAGPSQTPPANSKNFYSVQIQLSGSSRVRPVLGWAEGQGAVTLPISGINGATLVWGWTTGFTVPTDDVTTLDLTPEAEEVVVLRAHINALEKLLSDRVSLDKYFAIALRQAVSEADIATTIDALHESLEERVQRAVPLPERVR